MNSAPPVPSDLFRLTLATLFSAVGDHLADIAKPPAPKTLAEHLTALFMACTEFYHASGAAMPAELVQLLKDMRTAAHQERGAHALELMRAIGVIGHHPGLCTDGNVRLAISDANLALLAVVV